jgi:hypothetical protein
VKGNFLELIASNIKDWDLSKGLRICSNSLKRDILSAFLGQYSKPEHGKLLTEASRIQ